MAFAQGRASVYVVRGIGAIPPAWWQPMQRLASMRTISLLKVILVVMRSCAFPCHSRENEGKSEAATAQSNPLAFNIGKLYSKESHHGGKGSRVKRVKRQRYPPWPAAVRQSSPWCRRCTVEKHCEKVRVKRFR